jgi:2-polyprenyl-3-methyl-5-hydroxy-6-metoxy-1,4-benzoquinol methylase
MVDNRTVYDRTATTFASHIDRLINTGRYRRGNLFLSSALTSVSPNGNILDYGCGPGRISLLLARRGFRVRGIDPSPEMIAVAKQQFLDGLQVEFQCRPTIADQPTGFFDAITCSSVIEYVPDPEHLLRECLRVLRYNGVLIISFANRCSVSRALFQHRNLHLPDQKHLWDAHEFHQLLIGSGFRPMGKPRYFESLCDRLAPLTYVSRLQFVGTLGLFVAVNASY